MAQTAMCLPHKYEGPGSIPSTQAVEPGTVAHAGNLSTEEIDTEDLWGPLTRQLS